MNINTYKETPPYKDMIPQIIYVRKLEDGSWEVKGMDSNKQVYGLSTTDEDKVGECVAGVYNSITFKCGNPI